MEGRAHLESCLERFAALGGMPGFRVHNYRWSATFGECEHEARVVFGIMTHGDEVGPLEGALAVMESLAAGRSRFGGQVTFFVGNPEAGLEDRRFLEYDLNRVFAFDPTNTPDSHEHRRAAELRPILEEATFFLDFHQTILHTSRAFYIFPWHPVVHAWARALRVAEALVTRAPGQAFLGNQRCADEFVNLSGGTAFTVEMSQKGFDRATAAASERCMSRALALIDQIAAGETTVEQAAADRPELDCFARVHAEPWRDASVNLRPGLVNFQAIQAGERLDDGAGAPLIAPCDGLLLFPKYVRRDADGAPIGPLPGEIYSLLGHMPEHPAKVWG